MYQNPLSPERDKKVDTSIDIEKCVRMGLGSWERLCPVIFVCLGSGNRPSAGRKIGRELGALCTASLQSPVWEQC